MKRLARRARGRLALLVLTSALSACVTPPPPPAQPTAPSALAPPAPLTRPAAGPASGGPAWVPALFDEVPGFATDDLSSAQGALRASCTRADVRQRWARFCQDLSALTPAATDAEVRKVIKDDLIAMEVVPAGGSSPGLVTGYYEPLLRGSRHRVAPFLTPLYKVPKDLVDVDLASVAPQTSGQRLRGRVVGSEVVPYPTRAELNASHALAGNELLWVDDPVDAFFLEVQGSGRVQLFEHHHPTSTIRVAYADQNGQPYKSIGRWLIDQQLIAADAASMQGIRDWLARNPSRQDELFNVDPRVVFFKELPLDDPSVGPVGALGVPLVAQRSIAVDASIVPLGAPVFLATSTSDGNRPWQHLVAAQDTGAAIVTAPGSAVRVDIFFGTGEAAGEDAGRMKAPGRMWVLLPKEELLNPR